MFRSLAVLKNSAVPVARAFQPTLQRFSHIGKTWQHYDEPGNTVDTPFDFTAENHKRIQRILSRYPTNYKASCAIPLLDLAQRQVWEQTGSNFLPVAAMNKVAEILEVPPVKIYEVVSFYTMFNREKRGKWFVQICGTTPCMLCGSEDLKQSISKILGIKLGETTKDGLFSFAEVECMGCCTNAPMICINDDYYEDMNAERFQQIYDYIKKNDKLPPLNYCGSKPMNGQKSCEGPNGQTTLKGEIRGKYCRELPEKKVSPKQVYLDMYGDLADK